MRVSPRNNSNINIEENACNKNTNIFYNNIRFALILSQVFGIMPLHNLGNDSCKVKFKFLSWRCSYAFFHFICVTLTGLVCVIKMALKGFIVDETATMCFYIFNAFGSLYFTYMAMRWPLILKEYSYVEHGMKQYDCKGNIRKTNVWTVVIFMFFGLTEHILFILANIHQSLTCKNFKSHPVEIYFGCAFPQWFLVIPYSHWAGALVEFTNFISTFTWNYTDLFIILISISLREKFNQVSYMIHANNTPSNKFWKEIREDYYKISNLTKVVDNQIAGLVLISFLNNIVFLCIQLYNSIKERETIIDSLYFFYSFGYIVFRLIAVSLYSATLNEAARKPLKYLYCLSTENYTIDVSRLITQINYLPNGITGHGFFLITKNFLLQAAATVVTVELMIFQFSPVKTTTQAVISNVTCIR